jgi:hypothetical protein
MLVRWHSPPDPRPFPLTNLGRKGDATPTRLPCDPWRHGGDAQATYTLLERPVATICPVKQRKSTLSRRVKVPCVRAYRSRAATVGGLSGLGAGHVGGGAIDYHGPGSKKGPTLNTLNELWPTPKIEKRPILGLPRDALRQIFVIFGADPYGYHPTPVRGLERTLGNTLSGDSTGMARPAKRPRRRPGRTERAPRAARKPRKPRQARQEPAGAATHDLPEGDHGGRDLGRERGDYRGVREACGTWSTL